METSYRLFSATDPRFLLTGRVEYFDEGAVALVWQGTEVGFRFRGSALGLEFERCSGQNCLDLWVDGESRLVLVDESQENSQIVFEGFEDGWHDVVLYKRSEGYFGHVVLQGFLLEEGAELAVPRAETRRLIEFYGDSITVGACNQDDEVDQYEELSTHNHYYSFGAILARNLGAREISIAVSGIGVASSWNELLMGDVYDSLYPAVQAPRYDFQQYSPDAVVVALGENDFGHPRSLGMKTPAIFSDRYKELVKKIRVRYPKTPIVCLLGGLDARWDPEFLSVYEKVVTELQSDDAQVFRILITARSEGRHPRVAVHEKMAEELGSFFRDSLNWIN